MSTSTEAGADQRHPTADATGDRASAGVKPWILSGWQDLVFFVATPLLIIPLIAILQGYLTAADIALFVVSFGALGHHLPGMLRAYGDRELFGRFRVRFIVAPLFLLAVCGFFAQRNLNGLAVMTLLWGTWHGAAQIYGFLRIYDAKVKSFSPLTTRLDMAMCVAWFGLGLLQSPDRMDSILRAFYDSGGPLIAGSIVHTFQNAWTLVTAIISVAFLANWVSQWRQGYSPSPAKLFLMISSFGFWWYTMISIQNIILGVAMFEMFHDVQYLAIVWVYNVNRVEKASRVGAFTRFLFRRSWFLMGLYVGLVFAYGYIGWFGETVDTKNVKIALLALVTASGFLHFYYDGFIWKVREQSTREGLGMSGGVAQQNVRTQLPSWLNHGLKWSLFIVPVVLLGTAELRGIKSKLAREMAIVDAVPNSANAHNNLGVALAMENRQQDAVKHFRSALELNPKHVHAPKNLGGALQEMGQSKQAVAHLEEAIRIDAKDFKAHWSLGNALRALDRLDEAVTHYREVLRIKGDFPAVRKDLGKTLSQLGRNEEASQYFSDALRLDPDDAQTHIDLATSLERLGRFDEAVVNWKKAMELIPGHMQIMNNLAWLLATCPEDRIRDGRQAVELAQRAAEHSGYNNAIVLGALAASQAEVGNFASAVKWQRKALELASAEHKDEFREQLELYQAGKPYRQKTRP